MVQSWRREIVQIRCGIGVELLNSKNECMSIEKNKKFISTIVSYDCWVWELLIWKRRYLEKEGDPLREEWSSSGYLQEAMDKVSIRDCKKTHEC